MALLDNMYAPYSHLMRFANNGPSENCDPSITRLDVAGNSSNESSPTAIARPAGHYGGVMTMNLKLEAHQNFRPYVSDSPGLENNINEDNRRDNKVI